MLVHVLVVFLAVSRAALAVDKLPEVCGLDIVPKMTEEQKEEAEKAMEGTEDGTVDDLPEGAIVVGDMILNRDQAEAIKKGNGDARKKRNVMRAEKYRWDVNKPVYWSLDAALSQKGEEDKLVKNIKDSFKVFQRYTCIKFEKVPHTEQDPEKFHIMYREGARPTSSVGKQKGSTRKNFQTIVLKTGSDIGTILHETMHALGFVHEQERPDREQYVKINFDNIKQGMSNQFVLYPESLVEVLDEEYDFNSIMHYAPNAFGMRGGVVVDGKTRMRPLTTIEPTENYKTVEGKPRVIGALESLTAGDCRKLNKLFQCDMPSKQQIDDAHRAAEGYLKSLYEKVISKKVAQDYLSSLYEKVTEKAAKKVEGGVCELYEQKNNDK